MNSPKQRITVIVVAILFLAPLIAFTVFSSSIFHQKEAVEIEQKKIAEMENEEVAEIDYANVGMTVTICTEGGCVSSSSVISVDP